MIYYIIYLSFDSVTRLTYICIFLAHKLTYLIGINYAGDIGFEWKPYVEVLPGSNAKSSFSVTARIFPEKYIAKHSIEW